MAVVDALVEQLGVACDVMVSAVSRVRRKSIVREAVRRLAVA